MQVHHHASSALVGLNEVMPVPASVILSRLSKMEAPPTSVALEVCRIAMWRGARDASNGDSVVVIIRDGAVVTAMLRRSWNQPFTPEALRVDAVRSWHKEV